MEKRDVLSLDKKTSSNSKKSGGLFGKFSKKFAS